MNVQPEKKTPLVVEMSDWGTLHIRGQDSIDYLHRMTTVNFKKLGLAEVAWGAFLTGRAGVIALALFERDDAGVLIHLPKDRVTTVSEHIEKFHFAEQLECELVPWILFGLVNVEFGPDQSLGLEPRQSVPVGEWVNSPIQKGALFSGWWDPVLPSFFWSHVEKSAWRALAQDLIALGFECAAPDFFDRYRILAGIPKVPQELSETDIILEGNCAWAVARNKGCYPGQEVVERIFAYGSVNRKLFPVEVSPGVTPPFDVDGCYLVAVASGEDGTWRPGLAYIAKAQWSRTEPWKAGSATIRLRHNS